MEEVAVLCLPKGDPRHGLKSVEPQGKSSSSCHSDSGGVSEVGEVNEELETSPVMIEMPLVMEVSRLVGLSYDG